MRLKVKAGNAKHYKKWMRKGECPGCGVTCGMDHEKGCWARKQLLESLQGKYSEIMDNCPKTISGNHIWDEEVYRWKKGTDQLLPEKTFRKCRACGMYDDR